jgi:ferric-dicitrate binding protein FerR (iron transport regulator)
MNQKNENTIVKFFMNAANIEELERLTEWLKNPVNKQSFKNDVKINFGMDLNIEQFDTKGAKKEYLRKIKQSKRVFFKYRFYKGLKYAASVIIFFGLGYFFKNNVFDSTKESTPIMVHSKTILPGTDKATLTLEDGSVVALEKGSFFQNKNVKSNGEQIVYNPVKRTSKKIAYNYLTIPRAGQFHIILSDGTEVWLNSESKLKYPTAFIDGEPRQVELVYGEAYFKVSPSTAHKGSKFKVLNQYQKIEVLGTEFNMKAYLGETHVYTTLVEGAVKIVTSNRLTQDLKPDQQFNLNIVNNQVSVALIDAKEEISWKEGVFYFVDKPLKVIAKVLSRWYDVDIVFENKELESVEFIGVLDKHQSIEQILSIIKSTSIRSYEINGKTIRLK